MLFTTYCSQVTHELKGECKDNKFSCDKRYARYGSKASLNKHTCGRQFECERCERKFKREHDLRMHKEKQTMTCQNEYECYESGRKCRNSTHVNSHVLYQCGKTRTVPLDECRMCHVTLDTAESVEGTRTGTDQDLENWVSYNVRLWSI